MQVDRPGDVCLNQNLAVAKAKGQAAGEKHFNPLVDAECVLDSRLVENPYRDQAYLEEAWLAGFAEAWEDCEDFGDDADNDE